MEYITRLKIAWAKTHIVNKLTFLLTLVIAGANLTYVIYARKQFITMSGQLGQMQAASGQTDKLICLYQQQLAQLTKQAADTHELATQAGKQADRALLQADATNRIAKLTQDTLTVSQRSYVTIGTKDGVVAKFIPSQDLKQSAELVVYFQNSGHVPAKIAWGTSGLAFVAGIPGTNQSSGIKYSGPPFLGIPARTRDKKTGTIAEHGVPGQQSAVIAGDSILVAPIGEISPQDLADLPTKNVSTLVMGGYQYCDELGTNIRHSFGLSYQNAPDADLSFKLVFDNAVPFPSPASTPETEYLPPCQTLAERQ